MKVELALCQTEDPEMWFPISYQATGPQVMEAKAICRTCPIAADCLQYALQAGEDEGIWGGLTPSERRRARATTAASR